MGKLVEETVKGDWKIVTIAKDDEHDIDEKTGAVMRSLIDITEYRLIHIPTNKLVMVRESYEELNSVDSYDHQSWIAFSVDGLSVHTRNYNEYKLSELLEKTHYSAFFSKIKDEIAGSETRLKNQNK